MLIIGCDFHPRFQQIAYVDKETGEYGERRLTHPEEATGFYRSLAGSQVRVGMEATGNFRWFRRLLGELGHEVLLGDPAKIRAASVRKQKTDKRDARHILSLLMEDRFPVVWQPPAENAGARLLMTHPGVGPVVSLAYVLTIGDWQRFPRGKHVASYLPPQRRRPVAGDPGSGLIPEEESSSDKRRLGHIGKQGNDLLRWLLVEAAITAQKHDASWHRQYLRLSVNKHHGVAKVAIAHKLAIRLYWMLRSGEDYRQAVERGSHAGQSVCPSGGSGLTPRT